MSIMRIYLTFTLFLVGIRCYCSKKKKWFQKASSPSTIMIVTKRALYKHSPKYHHTRFYYYSKRMNMAKIWGKWTSIYFNAHKQESTYWFLEGVGVAVWFGFVLFFRNLFFKANFIGENNPKTISNASVTSRVTKSISNGVLLPKKQAFDKHCKDDSIPLYNFFFGSFPNAM